MTIKADGVKATISGEGKTIVFTYDDKRRALKIEAPGTPSNTYMDEDGYMYVKPPNMGWKKINIPRGMSQMMPAGFASASSGFESILSDNVADDNFFFPIVEWGIRFRMSAFERNPNFKKMPADCGKPQPCNKFMGIAGQELGTQAIFDPGGKLLEIKFKDNTIKYEYGKYNVQVPQAESIF